MTNAKVYQGFRDDKKVEEHWHKVNEVWLSRIS